MPLGAGRLNKRFTFQREIQTPDNMGGFTRAWGSDLVVWGRLMPERGNEAVAQSQLQGTATGLIQVRSSNAMRTVDETWRVLIDNKPNQIRSIQNDDQKDRFLTIGVERGVGT